MARFNVTVRPCKSGSRPHLKWVVNSYHPADGRSRSYFATREEADSHAEAKRIEVENFGIQALELSAGQRIEALDAFERLKPFSATLTEVVREYVERRRASTATMEEVVAKYLATRARLGRSKRHMDGLTGFLLRFNETFGKKRMADITSDHIQEWLHEREVSPVTSNHHRAMLHSVFAFAFLRKIVRENPLKLVELQSVKPGKVGILTPDQMELLLSRSANDPDVLATLAIGGFAGLRPEEIARLEWSAIDLEHGQIDCGAEITKTAKHRYVKIEPVLTSWLKNLSSGVEGHAKEGGYSERPRQEALIRKNSADGRGYSGSLPEKQTGDSRNQARPAQFIQGPNFRRRYDAVRKAAGFSVRKSDGVPWPHDALRHSYASYHLAKFKNAAELALQMGHETTAMIFSNYRARVRDADAERWWQMEAK